MNISIAYWILLFAAGLVGCFGSRFPAHLFHVLGVLLFVLLALLGLHEFGSPVK